MQPDGGPADVAFGKYRIKGHQKVEIEVGEADAGSAHTIYIANSSSEN
jgi:hypothetical protein